MFIKNRKCRFIPMAIVILTLILSFSVNTFAYTGWVEAGQWGGNGGSYFQSGNIDPNKERISSVTVWSGTVVDAINFTYTNNASDLRVSTFRFGGTGGNAHTMNIPKGVGIDAIFGRAGNVVDHLEFRLTNGEVFDMGGGNGGKPFYSQCSTKYGKAYLGGLVGRQGRLLDKIGFFLYH